MQYLGLFSGNTLSFHTLKHGSAEFVSKLPKVLRKVVSPWFDVDKIASIFK